MSETDGRVPGKRVLIVDDSVDTAKMMSLLLNLEGFETRTAFDGVKALEVGVRIPARSRVAGPDSAREDRSGGRAGAARE